MASPASAGTAVRTVRLFAERHAERLIRINPDDGGGSPGSCAAHLAVGALEGLRALAGGS